MCAQLGLTQIKIQPIGSFIRWVDKWLLSPGCSGGCDLSSELKSRRGALRPLKQHLPALKVAALVNFLGWRGRKGRADRGTQRPRELRRAAGGVFVVVVVFNSFFNFFFISPTSKLYFKTSFIV